MVIGGPQNLNKYWRINMNYNEFSEKLSKNAKEIGVELNEKKIKKFFDYMNLLLEWNEKINLTAIIDPSEVIVKHFIDSLTAAKYVEDNCKVIDVGTGAGFPGIPLKIYNESIDLTLLDSLNKRTIFLKEVTDRLEFSKIQIIHGRAEDYAQDKGYREQFDYAVSRAVAPLNVLLEYLVPYVKINGKVIALKGSSAEEEISESSNALKQLDTSICENEKVELPENSGERNILIMKKGKKTNKIYPRKAGTPKKKPL